MENKTKVNLVPGQQDVTVTREFDIPVELLFKAHTEAELIEQWKGIKVVKYAGQKHSGFEAEMRDAEGNVKARSFGTIHDLIPDKKLVRTFEVEGAFFGPSLEIYDFEKLTDGTSRLTMHMIYLSNDIRDQLMKMMPIENSLEKAFERLEQLFVVK